MGTYALLCCHSKREFIYPGHVNGGAIKIQHIPHRGDLGRLALHMLSYGYENRWDSLSLSTDDDIAPIHHDVVLFDYRDVTREAIESYNDMWEGVEPLLYSKR